ncbi:MAG: hypothetical protein ACK452_07405, partial [Bacteroidota bacterium]
MFRSHGFQTWAGQKVSAWLSDELNTIVSIQRLEIDFFSRVNLRGVYIQDLKKDTLLYGESLSLNIKDFNLSEKKMEIGVCKLDNIKAKLIKYKNDKDFNFQFLADYFTSTDTVKS